MFLAAVARPRFDYNKGAWFDGLIGIWEFAEDKVVKRTSINCPAGTTERVAIDKVTNKEHKDMLVKKVIPAIKAKFPTSSKNKPIYIQLDNAGPHTKRVDKLINSMSKADGWDIRMKKKPPCLPDFNILDLVSFDCLQLAESAGWFSLIISIGSLLIISIRLSALLIAIGLNFSCDQTVIC